MSVVWLEKKEREEERKECSSHECGNDVVITVSSFRFRDSRQATVRPLCHAHARLYLVEVERFHYWFTTDKER